MFGGKYTGANVDREEDGEGDDDEGGPRTRRGDGGGWSNGIIPRAVQSVFDAAKVRRLSSAPSRPRHRMWANYKTPSRL